MSRSQLGWTLAGGPGLGTGPALGGWARSGTLLIARPGPRGMRVESWDLSPSVRTENNVALGGGLWNVAAWTSGTKDRRQEVCHGLSLTFPRKGLC